MVLGLIPIKSFVFSLMLESLKKTQTDTHLKKHQSRYNTLVKCEN